MKLLANNPFGKGILPEAPHRRDHMFDPHSPNTVLEILSIAAAILTLTLGIGACTAIFSVVYAAMPMQLPYRDPDRLDLLWKSVPKKGLKWDWTSYPTFRDWRDNNHVFEDVALPSSVRFLPGPALIGACPWQMDSRLTKQTE